MDKQPQNIGTGLVGLTIICATLVVITWLVTR